MQPRRTSASQIDEFFEGDDVLDAGGGVWGDPRGASRAPGGGGTFISPVSLASAADEDVFVKPGERRTRVMPYLSTTMARHGS